MNLHATHAAENAVEPRPFGQSPAAGPPGRFAYATGARPLSGYTLKRGIGHGGFGEVYYATSDAGKEVALKLIRRNLDIELRGVTQCLNLKHPNLLSLYDVRQDDHGDNWVVMELMAGESLEQVLARNPDGLPPQEALAWIHGIAAGVAYLHDHGIVHRDLKPGNIFVDEGIVKIGDYGLSKFISCSRRSGQTGSVGTVHYMAPEVANGRYGKEIDIYALGVILYEILTGHVPFEGESIGEILMKHLTAEPDVSRLAEPYRSVVACALAKDPAKRCTTVHDMIAMLPPAPTNAALNAGARFAGPTPMVDRSVPAAPGRPESKLDTGFSLSPDIANRAAADAAVAQSAPQLNSVPEEPIARWVRETCSDLATWWESRNFQAWQKLLILFACLFVALRTLPFWLPTATVATIVYIAYRIVRAIVLANTTPSTPVAAQVPRGEPATAPVASHQREFVRPRFGSIGKALLMLFAAGAAMTIAGQTLERDGNLDRVLSNDDVFVAIPVGAFVAAVGFVLIHLFRLFTRRRRDRWQTSPRAHDEPSGYFARVQAWHSRLQHRFLWMLAIGLVWIAAAWMLVAMDVGASRMSDKHAPQVMAVMAILAAIAGSLYAIYRAATPAFGQWRGVPSAAPGGAGDAAGTAQAAYQASAPIPVARSGQMESPTRRRWRQAALVYQSLSPRERLTQLIGSMLLSALVCFVVALVMMILRGEMPEPAQYAWLSLSAMVGSWGILIPAKFWEGDRGDPAMRRFVMLVVGLAFGIAAFGLLDWTLAHLPRNGEFSRGINSDFARSFYTADGTAKPIAFLAYFGFLFTIPRWWRQADPLRSTRLSIWHTAVALFWAAVLSVFWPFPQPWGWMLTGTIAIAVQLAAPWLSPSERIRLAERTGA